MSLPLTTTGTSTRPSLKTYPLLALRYALLLPIRIYQKLLSPVLPALFGSSCACRFHPTCSHYATEAIQTHGALRGALLTLIRLTKCTPLHPGGLDPVPPRKQKPVCTQFN